MDLEQLARETAEGVKTVIHNSIMPDQNTHDKVIAVILEALDEAVKETQQDLLELLASTDETVALHSKFTGRYRGI